LTITYNCSLLS